MPGAVDVEALELDRSLARHAVRRRIPAHLGKGDQPIPPASSLPSVSKSVTTFRVRQLFRLLADAEPAGEMRRHILRPVVGGEGVGEDPRGELRESRGVGRNGAPELEIGLGHPQASVESSRVGGTDAAGAAAGVAPGRSLGIVGRDLMSLCSCTCRIWVTTSWPL